MVVDPLALLLEKAAVECLNSRGALSSPFGTSVLLCLVSFKIAVRAACHLLVATVCCRSLQLFAAAAGQLVSPRVWDASRLLLHGVPAVQWLLSNVQAAAFWAMWVPPMDGNTEFQMGSYVTSQTSEACNTLQAAACAMAYAYGLHTGDVSCVEAAVHDLPCSLPWEGLDGDFKFPSVQKATLDAVRAQQQEVLDRALRQVFALIQQLAVDHGSDAVFGPGALPGGA